jgi:hypothetical protein
MSKGVLRRTPLDPRSLRGILAPRCSGANESRIS